ncbi:MAG: SDR family oxidoreductase [Bryobacteraceae bacterium]
MGRPLALVTGASSGIGATFARALASRGYSLILVARRKERLEALASEINAEALVADLTKDAELKLVEDRIAAADNLELLVNNAGFGTLGHFWEADLEGQDKMHRLHVLATMRLTHAALRGMVARGSGGVINVASVAGFVHRPGSTSYGATKSWMNAFTEGLYLELKSVGSPVKVQALCPGLTYSEFHDVAGVERNSIAKSLWMHAEDVVAASLRGLDCGDLFVIPGWRYKLLVRLLAIVPNGLRRWGTLRYAPRAKRV